MQALIRRNPAKSQSSPRFGLCWTSAANCRWQQGKYCAHHCITASQVLCMSQHLKYRACHCISSIVYVTVSQVPCMSLHVKYRACHCVSSTVHVTASQVPCMSLCLKYRACHCVSCITVSQVPASQVPCMSLHLKYRVHHCRLFHVENGSLLGKGKHSLLRLKIVLAKLCGHNGRGGGRNCTCVVPSQEEFDAGFGGLEDGKCMRSCSLHCVVFTAPCMLCGVYCSACTAWCLLLRMYSVSRAPLMNVLPPALTRNICNLQTQ
jgi:hypothetical protein